MEPLLAWRLHLYLMGHQNFSAMKYSKLCAIILAIIYLSSCASEQDTLFQKLSSSASGVDFRNALRHSEDFNIMKYSYYYNGAGLGVGDFNNDGLQDLVFAGNMVKNRVYINEGELHFKDITKSSGLYEYEGWSTGISIVDINGDGYDDIYVCRSGYPFESLRRNLLFINNQDLTFTESADFYGLDDPGYSTQAAFFDFDKDGDLDMFLANQSSPEFSLHNQELLSLKKRVNPLLANKLYINMEGKYFDVTSQAGIKSNALTFSLGLSVGDVNGDMWPDIFVGNDFNEPDYLYINNQNGTFTDHRNEAFDHVSLYSMGSEMADLNNDGWNDIVSLDMLSEDNYQQKMHMAFENHDKLNMLQENGFHNQVSANMLHLNNGNGQFSEIGQLAGISATDWSWSVMAPDLNLDGFKDLVITNGYAKDNTNLDFINFGDELSAQVNQGKKIALETYADFVNAMPEHDTRNYVYKNINGLEFEDVSINWGFDEVNVSQGAAYADLDNDGDLDLILNNTNAMAEIYENHSADVNALQISLKQEGHNHHALGAKVTLWQNGNQQMQELMPVRGFQSTIERKLTFGLGAQSQIDSLVIVWPDLTQQTVLNVAAGHHLISKSSHTEFQINEYNKIFQKVSTQVYRTEKERSDFKIQPLLFEQISKRSIRLTLADLTNDGISELITVAADGKMLKIYRISSSGELIELKEIQGQGFQNVVAADLNNNGLQDLYVTVGDYQGQLSEQSDMILWNQGALSFEQNKITGTNQNNRAVNPIDFDQDGDQDLFVGGYAKIGSYPLAEESFILENMGKQNFQKRALPIASLLVADVAVGDISRNGKAELVIVSEWNKPLVLSFEQQWVDVTSQFLSNIQSGLYKHVNLSDLNEDGRLDMILGNQGQNQRFRASESQPAKIHYADIDQNGTIDPMVSYFNGEVETVISGRDELMGQLPSYKKKYLKYDSYAQAELKDLMPLAYSQDYYSATSLQTQVWLSTDSSFIQVNLPAEVQMSSTRASVVQDFDQDGLTDILLLGNSQLVRPQYGPVDANHGLLLHGQSDGSWRPSSFGESNLALQGQIDQVEMITTPLTEYLIIGQKDSIKTFSWSARKELSVAKTN